MYDYSATGNRLIEVDVTAFSMYSAGDATYQIVPTGVGAFTGTAATGLMEDRSLTTGYASLRSLTLSFLEPVVNRPGADIYLFELSPTETGRLDVTLNSQTINIAGAVEGGNFALTGAVVDRDIWRSTTLASSVAILEGITIGSAAAQWRVPNDPTASNVTLGYHGIDLSNYGVNLGDSVSSITLAGDSHWDITAVMAVIPEPSTIILVVMGLAAGLIPYRRHRGIRRA